FPAASARALERAMDGFVRSDIPLLVEFSFVDEEEIRRLNAQTRGIDKVTDVLSYPTLDGIKGQAICAKDFPYDTDEGGNLLIGSVAVCLERAKQQAQEYGHSFERELHYLLVHGIMHCLGYDHMTDDERAEMRTKEEWILGELGITRGEEKGEEE
ncbi:MAG: rRNA maturation RNase YbeY, partial [Clostridia bacterium]|nr:rRNA maturation RNase YbeY [Clostridia bacterium]